MPKFNFKEEHNNKAIRLFVLQFDINNKLLLCSLLYYPFSGFTMECYSDIQGTQWTHCSGTRGFRTCFTKYDTSKVLPKH